MFGRISVRNWENFFHFMACSYFRCSKPDVQKFGWRQRHLSPVPIQSLPGSWNIKQYSPISTNESSCVTGTFPRIGSFRWPPIQICSQTTDDAPPLCSNSWNSNATYTKTPHSHRMKGSELKYGRLTKLQNSWSKMSNHWNDWWINRQNQLIYQNQCTKLMSWRW